ncbi:MAG: DNA repair protein RecN [Cyanobacteriota bacterium]|nr:DNA repair protein RecN [Cyanobacteriota bacterium]MDY6358009.1 DNA repair protein RecN [Cyanobacteriota bacterium]MDY6364291.1 DNA repair protein RecN [Cyanobacteriota bacterium]MDY6383281.1 DNA repair protein RecN [Cyanobacteriota bacterium]
MIKQLKLKNYILIDELCANFDKGLNVITGETGAGKSILLNAIDLVFSNRVSKDVIKTGCDKALIEIILENHHDVSEIFEQNGIDDCGEEITISKEITQNSVRSRINGTMVNQELLKRLRTLFVDIHSQHQTYTFLQPQYHITLLDAYAKDFYGETLAKYKKLYKEYSNLQKQLSEAQGTANAAQSQIDFLKFEINEIEDAQITSANEDTELENELEVLNNAEKLKELTGSAYWTINGDDESIIETLSKIKNDLSKAAGYDPKLEDINNDFIAVNESLRDIASYLRDYSQNLNSDEQRLNDIQERLFVLDKLKRKYGGSLEAVQKTYNDASEELSKIEFSTKNIEELTSKINTLKDELMQLAQLISKSRSDYAKVLSVLIQDKLEVLELPKSRFEIRITPKDDLLPDGIDNVEFMISTNVSEDLKPLAKVASGGEISRVMLAIKSIFANTDDIDTVIFDEIDTGISGHAAQSVADEIENLSKSHQVIVITHQPIIASKADKHFYVRKSQEDETKVEVYVLQGENRIKALAELAGGDINDRSIEFAKSLLAK